MTDRLPPLDAAGIELALSELSSALEWPPTPGLAEAVGDAVSTLPRRGLVPFWRPMRRGLALALLAALLLVGLAAAAIGFALGGLRISFGEPPAASPLAPSQVLQRGLGEEVSLDKAAERLGFTMLLPTDPALEVPAHVFVADPPTGGALALVWDDQPGLPADPESGIGLVITEFRADIGPEVFEKLLDAGVRVVATSVNGLPGYWIEGGDHFFFYRDANGQIVDTTLRLVGPTLVWERDGLTLRIEGAPTVDEAVRIAASLTPRE
jgi:hypothetical protein